MRYKTSDVIALAVADPRYLSVHDNAEFFLCRMLKVIRDEGTITHTECHAAHNTIDRTINYKCTLYNHLFCERVKGFREAASHVTKQPNDIRVQFWAMLCMRLKAQGK